MRLLISDCRLTMQFLAPTPLGQYLGHLLAPNDPEARGVVGTGLPYAVLYYPSRYYAPGLLRSLLVFTRELPNRPLFIAPPVFPAKASKTSAMFAEWRAEIEAYGPVAFVAQNPKHHPFIRWDALGALVLQGTPGWLHSTPCAAMATAAKRAGVHLHLAEVQDYQDLQRAHDLRADSVSLPRCLKRPMDLIAPYALYIKQLVTGEDPDPATAEREARKLPVANRSCGWKGGEA